MAGGLRSRLRDSSPDLWRTATWAAPLMVQGVFAVAVGFAWLLSRFPINSDVGRSLVIAVATTAATVVSLLIGVKLQRADSPRRRGQGLALGGAGLAAAAVGWSYALSYLLLLGAP
ncbi:hypothetical protein AWC18_10510 [Mycolicibacter nonchromogenicus]|uniref:Uncharacterized protein n=1 Tax=Mycolicibacter nonchromogenicus TaxID=1782 RepID=A0A1X1ZDP1_MYCNO|nr:hypothetical protein [Mycolicibacter nonchromogenicus]ORW21291.1 hypothetical protein AWC18_10510 [Mycolicibacter nonchromogenicus]